MVFYRKYRPQTIQELDNSELRDKLYSILSAKAISHAFLFTGPKGLGKTSTARIVAKVVNCENKLKVENGKLKIKGKENSQLSTLNSQLRKVEPCNKCDHCISITNGTNIDVLEIDAASNRGIDEIRDLREKVRLSPARASKKVYIIDEVHMLTTEAFNALLKTLEEPPPHVVFILCTTEVHKLPATIISRCTHIVFKKAETDDLVHSFERIAKAEEINIDDESLTLIASLSDGSFRDGAKILEEVVQVSDGKKIIKDLIEQKYQISNIQHQIDKMVEFLASKNTKEALTLISKLTEQGVDTKYFLEKLIEELHRMMLVKVGVNGVQLEVQNSEMSIGDIKALTELLIKAHMELKYAVLPQLPLEIVVIEWGESKRHSGNQALPEHPESEILKQVQDDKRDSGQARMTGGKASSTNNFWQDLINRVKLHNHSIAGVLRGCSIKSYNNESLVIETGFKFHKERLEDKKAREIIEKVCKDIAGKPVAVSVIMKMPA